MLFKTEGLFQSVIKPDIATNKAGPNGGGGARPQPAAQQAAWPWRQGRAEGSTVRAAAQPSLPPGPGSRPSLDGSLACGGLAWSRGAAEPPV